jgi:hypothetical protein
MKKAIAIASLLIGVFGSALRGFAAFRGDKFYLNVQEVWLVAPNPEGPWASARGLGDGTCPTASHPIEPYILCALP